MQLIRFPSTCSMGMFELGSVYPPRPVDVPEYNYTVEAFKKLLKGTPALKAIICNIIPLPSTVDFLEACGFHKIAQYRGNSYERKTVETYIYICPSARVKIPKIPKSKAVRT